MKERKTYSEITFANPFVLEGLVTPLEAGTYRLVVDEQLTEGLSFPSYQPVATHLEIPAVSAQFPKRQFLQVSATEIEEVLRKDAELQGDVLDALMDGGVDAADP
ncbi:hypothetical protein [Agrobacterium tumefaciens]|uniref:hypothetical protein n=1 Tax=Agrobacterium tumefaciens TaxID=358 RepID=UPI0015717533|nr:hypothetical protein [Agrobacterium tumefaciens]NTD86742.1 hypothetical protein [Agrobacterium tumefaciens]NTD91469.1 hypothetical protein [Agrobacterium tumefaciens]NTD96940.1 hypothetical protein [Agrobacterium tumefaciens]NTE11841.1 hypothetical protein [Agrobacterium tumefaciens]NTE24739.1 hypothetical protein [Agrobacterium tumefaciens]